MPRHLRWKKPHGCFRLVAGSRAHPRDTNATRYSFTKESSKDPALAGNGSAVPTRGSPRTQAGVRGTRRGQSLLWRRRHGIPRGDKGRRRRTWTHSSTEGFDRVVHAVEFSKTAAPLQEGCPSQGHAPKPAGAFRDGPTSIALSDERGQPASSSGAGPLSPGRRAG